jgi:hypothetical protein
MHKEKIGNHMEDYFCVGVFIMSMIIHKLILGIHNHALYLLLSKTCYRNKFENLNKEKTNFLLQEKWNNFFKKTCGCKTYCYCKNV